MSFHCCLFLALTHFLLFPFCFVTRQAPRRAYEPKVQTPYIVRDGQVPRKIEVERRKREYAAQDLTALLQEGGGLDPADLLPAGPFRAEVARLPTRRSGFLPLEYFDDVEYDVRTPEEWISLGKETGVVRGVPARALACLDAAAAVSLQKENERRRVLVLPFFRTVSEPSPYLTAIRVSPRSLDVSISLSLLLSLPIFISTSSSLYISFSDLN